MVMWFTEEAAEKLNAVIGGHAQVSQSSTDVPL